MNRHDPATDGPLQEAPGGVLLHVLAQPKARRNELGGVRNGRLLVRVTSPPEDGKANAAIIKLLAKALGIAPGRVQLQSGLTSREKLLLFENVDAQQAKSALSL